MRPNFRAWLAVIVLVLAGCSQADPGQQYLAAADAYNGVLAQAPAATAELETIHEFAARMAAADRAFTEALRRISFPSGAQQDVQKLLTLTASEELLWRQVAAAPTLGTVVSIKPQLSSVRDQAGAAARQVRLDLGLPGGALETPGAS